VLTLSQAPESSRGALMMPLEGGRQWLATLGGRHGEKPPGDGDGFVSFAQHLPTPTLYNAIQARKSNKTVSTSWSFTGDRWFESISLQRRVCELSVPLEMRDRTGDRLRACYGISACVSTA
jgi:hypothetical protein